MGGSDILRFEGAREAYSKRKHYLTEEVSYSPTSHHLYLGIFHTHLSVHGRRKIYLSPPTFTAGAPL